MFSMHELEAEALIKRLPFRTGVQVEISQVEFTSFLNQRLHDLPR